MLVERKVQLSSLEEIKDFIVMAGKYRCDIKVKTKNKIVDGKSMMGIVSLAAHQPLTVVAHRLEPPHSPADGDADVR